MEEQEARRGETGRRNAMRLTGGLFERLPRGHIAGRVMVLSVLGRNIRKQGSPLLARVGSQPVLEIVISDGGLGFSGLLASIPNNGDRLYVQYAGHGEIETNVIYQAPDRSRFPVA